MNVHAMICELNPLHNGHLSVIERMKRDDDSALTLLIMSGNFTQRAGAALFDKYARSRAALECGADIVVELPFPFSSSGAEYFARAGVHLAEGLGASRLYFGSECGDVERLYRIAEIVGSTQYRAVCDEICAADPTLGAAAVRERALCYFIPDCAAGATGQQGAPSPDSPAGTAGQQSAPSPDSPAGRAGWQNASSTAPAGRAERPNDTLAAEYIRNAHIPCVAVKRTDTASASAIREMTDSEAADFVPGAVLEMMARENRSDAGKFRRILWESLRLRSEAPEAFAECGGGLGERLFRIARESTDAGEFFCAAATKRYTNSRIMRASLFALLGVTARDIAAVPQYAVLLAASARGREYLAARRRSEHAMPLVTKPADVISAVDSLSPESAQEGRRLAELWRRADELYTLTLDVPREAGHFMRCRPYMG